MMRALEVEHARPVSFDATSAPAEHAGTDDATISSSPPRLAPRIVAVGSSVPPDSYSQEELLRAFRIEDERVRGLFLNSAISRRHLTLPPVGPDGRHLSETQGELLRKHTSVGVRIAGDALTTCLHRADADVSAVRFLCCVSSTGFITPGFSALLIKELGLSHECSRLDVVGMGCNAGLNALSAVGGWSTMHPGQLAVMVCVEVCSAAYVFDESMRTSVVNSLFGDGAAAIAVVATENEATSGPALVGMASRIIPDALGAMRYDWDEDSCRFSFFLDPDIPYVIGAHVEESLERLLSEVGLRRSDVAHWLIHSGGKKVIDAVRINLRLTQHDLRHTRSVLRDYGNVSSASFLFSYERLLREDVAVSGDYGVMMTMGPGSTVEMALLQW